MKLTLRKLRNLIKEALLLESSCPKCGNKDAYVGLSDVECPNPQCKFFSARQAKDIEDEKKKKLAAAKPTSHTTAQIPSKHPSKKKATLSPKTFQNVLRRVGVTGISASDGELDDQSLDDFVNQNGFEVSGDHYFPIYVDPKNWRQVAGPTDAANPDDVVYNGSYDEIWIEALSTDAKKIARTLNDPAINTNIGQHDYADPDGLDPNDEKGHFTDIYMDPDLERKALGPIFNDDGEDITADCQKLGKSLGIKPGYADDDLDDGYDDESDPYDD